MINIVNYKECICDVCGKHQTLLPSLPLPGDWHRISVQYENKTFDICDTCYNLIHNFMNDIRRNEK